MGVLATYCLVCGLPVQHDHYVATERENYWNIYRLSHKPPGHFPFTARHDWLLRGVALPTLTQEEPHFGSCEDGSLMGDDGQSYYVCDGYDQYGALHAYCWNSAGRPAASQEVLAYRNAPDWTFVERYQEQLFDFARCQADGNGWLLLDPDQEGGEANKQRIDRILKTL